MLSIVERPLRAAESEDAANQARATERESVKRDYIEKAFKPGLDDVTPLALA